MNKSAFTLMELMIAAAVLSIALLGLLGVFTRCFGLNETAKNLTIAINGAQEKLEQIRNLRDAGTPRPAGHYSENVSNFPVQHRVAIDIFDDGTDPDGISNSDLFWISVSVSWKQKGGRIIGEDNGSGGGIPLNGGIPDGTEDANINQILDSPAQIITLMSK